MSLFGELSEPYNVIEDTSRGGEGCEVNAPIRWQCANLLKCSNTEIESVDVNTRWQWTLQITTERR